MSRLTQADLKVFDELRATIEALDRKIGRMQEQVSRLTHEVDQLKQRQPPLDLRGTQ